MPRKPLLYIHDYPYHVVARSNNREWFYIPRKFLWEIFRQQLQIMKKRYGVRIYAFVLMDNHYHMLLSTSEDFYLGDVMQFLQKSVSRRVNSEAGRINHVFGGPYKGSLIISEHAFSDITKYIYRNPVKAGIVSKAEEYMYSTIKKLGDPLIEACPDFDRYIPKDRLKCLEWLNTPHSDEQDQVIKRALKKTAFRIPKRQKHLFE